MTDFCACGCGKVPPVARRTDLSRGVVEGQRCRYLRGHHGQPRLSIIEDRGYETPCRIADGRLVDGYGMVTVDGRRLYAHVASYEATHGPVPEGFELDHLCRQRACVRVDHLEVVTHAENVRRGKSAKLNPEQVAEIRRLIRAAEMSQEEIAVRFGVKQAAINKIKLGQVWA